MANKGNIIKSPDFQEIENQGFFSDLLKGLIRY